MNTEPCDAAILDDRILSIVAFPLTNSFLAPLLSEFSYDEAFITKLHIICTGNSRGVLKVCVIFYFWRIKFFLFSEILSSFVFLLQIDWINAPIFSMHVSLCLNAEIFLFTGDSIGRIFCWSLSEIIGLFFNYIQNPSFSVCYQWLLEHLRIQGQFSIRLVVQNRVDPDSPIILPNFCKTIRPVFQVQVHQSGVNAMCVCFDYASQLAQIVSGGDDQCLVVTNFTVPFSQPKFFAQSIFHSAAVKGLNCSNGFVFSVGDDQVLNIFKLLLDEDGASSIFTFSPFLLF